MANNLTRFNPFSDIARLDPLRGMDELFNDFRLLPSLRGFEPEPRIRMDMSETDEAYIVKAEIPGVSKDDIKVSIDGNQVSISAEVKREEDRSSGSLIRNERYVGQQFRSFTLPREVDDKNAQAKYVEGVLELTLPKIQGSGAKQLTIQ